MEASCIRCQFNAASSNGFYALLIGGHYARQTRQHQMCMHTCVHVYVTVVMTTMIMSNTHMGPLMFSTSSCLYICVPSYQFSSLIRRGHANTQMRLSHNRTPASLRLMICSVLAGTCSKLVARLCAPILRSWSMIPHAPLSCRQAPQPSPDRLDRHENTKSTSEASQGSMKRTSSHLDVSAEHQQSQGHTPKKGDRSRI